MFLFAPPLMLGRVRNIPAVPVIGGVRDTTGQSTTLNLAGAVVGDFIVVGVFSTSASVSGGAGGWEETTFANVRALTKSLEAADLVSGALTCGAAPWAFEVYRTPRSRSVKASGSAVGSSGLTLTGFTKHARSAGVIAITLGTSFFADVTTANWDRRQRAGSGVGNSIQIYDLLSPDVYPNGTTVAVSGKTAATTQALLIELVNLGVTVADTTAPTFTSANSVSVAENSTLAHTLATDEFVTFTIRTSAENALSVDYARFEISGTTLRWLGDSTKNYEAPDDTGANNSYVVVVRAADGSGNTTDQTITVTVTNVVEGGSAGSPVGLLLIITKAS